MVGVEREHWKGRIDFLLACIGYCVGAGNVWRFPYLCFIHGGSAFLLPYIILTVIVALPLFFLEVSVGQFTSQGAVTAWGMTPLLSGLGWAMVLISAMICVYYNVIIMYSLLYIFLSLVNIGWAVPWASCRNTWNNREVCLETPLPDLESFESVSDKISHSLAIKHDSCVQDVSDDLGIGSGKDQIEAHFTNNYPAFEGNYSKCNISYTLPAQQYWNNFILELSDEEHIGSTGSLIGRNTIFLFFAWVVIFVCIIKGPRSIAKVVYFTATFPLGILVIFLIRGLNSEGFNDGIDYYAIPKWDRLLDPGVWGAAAAQVLFSVGIGQGGLLTFSSYNKFNHNLFRDTLIVVSVNAGASIFAGFVTFALIGSIAHDTNMPVKNLAGSGPELVFVIYPQGLSSLPSPAIWAFLYFLMVFTLGLDSQFGMMETIIVGVTDRFPDSLGQHRIKFVMVCCVVGFLLGLPLTTKGGMHVFNFMNYYSASYAPMVLALLELIMTAWIYGVGNFVRDIELMIGHKHIVFWLYWKAHWLVITPIIIVLMLIMALISYAPAEYQTKIIPPWAEFIGWLMVIAPILCVIGRAIKVLLYRKVPIREALKPSKTYRPRHEQNPDQEYVERERHNIEVVEPEVNREPNTVNDYYLNPIADDQLTENNETLKEANQRNPSLQTYLQENPTPCRVASEPQATPSVENMNIEEE